MGEHHPSSREERFAAADTDLAAELVRESLGETAPPTQLRLWPGSLEALADALVLLSGGYPPSESTDINAATQRYLTHSSAQARRTLPPGAPRVIGICGLPRSGKDSLAQLLLEHYRGVRRLAFSDAIIAEVNTILTQAGLPPIDEQSKNLRPLRHLLQEWGMLRREQQGDYWVVKMQERIESALRSDDVELILITGVRQANEADLIRGLGGQLWLIERPALVAAEMHPAELQVADRADRIFTNNDEPHWQPMLLAAARAALEHPHSGATGIHPYS